MNRSKAAAMSILFSFIFLTLIGQPTTSDEPTKSYHFKNGEQLDFKLSYGWFTVGKASLSIDDVFHEYENEDCYKVDVQGSTAGLLGVFTHVDDRWGAYIKKNDLKPLHAYRNIEEGRYLRVERTYFHHDKNRVEVLRYDPRKKERKPKRVYDVQGGVNDLMSSYLELRNMDFTQYQKGDTIRLRTFYEDELYHFKLVYDGVITLDSKIGSVKSHKIFFLVPPSDVFPNEHGIVAYISADANQLPLRIEAEMFFGKGYCDLVSYRNIKYGPDYQ